MKKFIMVSMIALIAAFGFVGCGSDDDGSKADLRWINKQGNNVSEIQWMSSSEEDQRWGGTYADDEPTGYKGISSLSGNGECLFDDDGTGIPQPIEIDNLDPDQEGIAVPGTDSVVVSENANATLVIKSYTKK